MTEDLISFETAKLAKEKGFPQLNQGVYFTKDKEHCVVGYGIDNIREYSASTQSLLQKWLREKHKLHIFIQPHNVLPNSLIIYNGVIMKGMINPKVVYTWTNKTYEEALEIGLQEALKLI